MHCRHRRRGRGRPQRAACHRRCLPPVPHALPVTRFAGAHIAGMLYNAVRNPGRRDSGRRDQQRSTRASRDARQRMARFIPVEPFDLVIFGGTGDLAERKLLPALYHRDRDDQLSDDSRIIGVSRQPLSDADYRAKVRADMDRAIARAEIDDAVYRRFESRLSYAQLDLASTGGWEELAARLNERPGRVRVYYLATANKFFGPVAERLAALGLNSPESRIVLEKPLGDDLASTRAINSAVGAAFSEDQIFRIDHYLGKETVQNILALRFANTLIEPLWTRAVIDHVQITVAESIGIGDRGEFYDRTGALRDMLQNHILQLLCLVAMSPPTSLDHDEIRDEKLKILRALRPIGAADVEAQTVRGQYIAGAAGKQAVPGYREELDGVASDTETFVALKAHIDTWRWAGVPFYLRTGKRLSVKSSEIVIVFRQIAHSIFPADAGHISRNRLTIRLQPNEGVTMSVMTKEPGPGGFRLSELPLNLSFNDTYQLRYPDAYERLLMEVVRGNPALFMRCDEVEAAWAWIDGIIAGWHDVGMPVRPYMAGSWGPGQADVLVARDGRSWHNTLDP